MENVLVVANTNVYEFQNFTIYGQTKAEVIDYLKDVPLFSDDVEGNTPLIKLIAEHKYIIIKPKHIKKEVSVGLNKLSLKNKVIEDKHLTFNGFFDTEEQATLKAQHNSNLVMQP